MAIKFSEDFQRSGKCGCQCLGIEGLIHNMKADIELIEVVLGIGVCSGWRLASFAG
jgi:hypothetical protein